MSTSYLSNPFMGNFRKVAQYLCEDLGAIFLEKLKEELLPNGELADLTKEHLKSDSACDFYQPELGTAVLMLNSKIQKNISEKTVQAQYILACFLSGALPKISLQGDFSHSLIVAGHSIPPGAYKIVGDSSEIRVKNLKTDKELVLHRYGDDQVGYVWAEDFERDVINCSGLGYVVMVSQDWMVHWSEDDVDDSPKDNLPEFKRQVEEAFDFLRASSPEYFVWALSLLKYISPLVRIDKDTIASRTSLYWFGSIMIAHPANVLESIEMIIHETSHLYYNLLMWWNQPVKEGAPEVYSKLKDRNRPLERLLLGYHAFGNVALFMANLKTTATPFCKAEYNKRINHINNLVDELSVHLAPHAEEHFTEHGNKIYQPLRDKLDHADLSLLELEKVG